MYTSARIVQFNNIAAMVQGVPHMVKIAEMIVSRR